jgi:hypothetical protein
MRVWAILRRLPFVFWTKEALESIRNKLKVFIGIDPKWESKDNIRWAWIQIKFNVRDRLIGSLDFVFRDGVWHQKIYYWKILFCCYGCHEIRHIKSKCSRIYPFFKKMPKVWVKRNMEDKVSLKRSILDIPLIEG